MTMPAHGTPAPTPHPTLHPCYYCERPCPRTMRFCSAECEDEAMRWYDYATTTQEDHRPC